MVEMKDVLVITEHMQGEFQEITFEMLGSVDELVKVLKEKGVA